MGRANTTTVHTDNSSGGRAHKTQKPHAEIARFWSDRNRMTAADVETFKREVKTQLGIPLGTPITCDVRLETPDGHFRLVCSYAEEDSITRVLFLSLSADGDWTNTTPDARKHSTGDVHEHDVVYYENYQMNRAFFVVNSHWN